MVRKLMYAGQKLLRYIHCIGGVDLRDQMSGLGEFEMKISQVVEERYF